MENPAPKTSEEPQSIWKKSWKGPRSFFLLFALLVGATFIVTLCIELLSGGPGSNSDHLVPPFICAAVVALVMLAIVFVRWLRSWRNFRRFLIGAACAITLSALFHVEENWRGKRAWENYEREQVAKGETFDASKLIPPRVPDEQNFAMTPFFAPLFDFLPGTQKQRDTNAVERTYRFAENWAANAPPGFDSIANTWRGGRALDLTGWTNRADAQQPAATPFTDRATAAAAILREFEKYRPVLEEIQVASHRPESRFNVAYECEEKFSILLPHLAKIKLLCTLLQVRASAELAAGQTDRAFEDVKLILFLTDSIQSEPFVITHLVRFATLTIALQPIWEGLAEHRWSAAQVETLQQRLQKYDFFRDGHNSLNAERVVLGGDFFEHLRTGHDRLGYLRALSNMSETAPPPPGWLAELAFRLFVPRGWIYFEQLTYHRLFQQQILPTDAATRQIDPEMHYSRNVALEKELTSGNLVGAVFNHHLLSRMLLPGLLNFHKKEARCQNSADLAVVACALERYRMANGQFPETLDALTPKFIAQLPHDVIMGGPLKYRRTDDGQFVLYSIGWDKKDDGGDFALKKDSSLAIWEDQRFGPRDQEAGDWAWRYPVEK